MYARREHARRHGPSAVLMLQGQDHAGISLYTHQMSKLERNRKKRQKQAQARKAQKALLASQAQPEVCYSLRTVSKHNLKCKSLNAVLVYWQVPQQVRISAQQNKNRKMKIKRKLRKTQVTIVPMLLHGNSQQPQHMYNFL